MSSTHYSVGFNNDDKLSSKVLKPPGGECSDIFGTQSNLPQQDGRRGRYQQSAIFGTENNLTSNNQSPAGRRDSDTQNRLFGYASEESSPRRVVDRMKSNIFTGSQQVDGNYSNSKKQVRRNPITGEIYDDDDDDEIAENGHLNGNGIDPGNPITGEGARIPPAQISCVKIKNPPGGKSSGIF